MQIKDILIKAYTQEFSGEVVDVSAFRQANPKTFKAIVAVFGNYGNFTTEVRNSIKPAPVPAVKPATIKKDNK